MEFATHFGDAKAGNRRSIEWMSAGPQVADDYRSLWEAFGALQTQRPQTGMGMSPIAILDIASYADVFGFTRVERDQLIGVIRALDNHHRTVLTEKNDNRSKVEGL